MLLICDRFTCECIDKYSYTAYFKQNCGITQVPSDIPEYSTFLHLGRNEIATIHEGAFSYVTLRIYIDSQRNKLTYLRANMFTGLKYLKVLGFGSNQITYIEAGAFANLTLTHLWLNNNRLETVINETDVRSSKHLDLAYKGNPLICDARMCWLKHSGLISWTRWYGKPECKNYPGVDWDNVTLDCPLTGRYHSRVIIDLFAIVSILKEMLPVQGLFVPFARLGSGDPVRVLCLIHNNTLDTVDAFIANEYVQLVATKANVLLYCRLPMAVQLWAP